MDALTVLLSVLLAVPVQLLVMYFVYSRWILPAINSMVSTLPSKVREYTEPFINEKITEISKTVKASSARFQRTVNQAAAALDLDGIDLETDEGVQAAQEQLSKRYGLDVAIQAVGQLIQSIEANKKGSKSQKGDSVW